MSPKKPKVKPEPAEAKIQRAIQEFQQRDESYRDVWINEAVSTHQRGIYQHLSKIMDLTPGAVHLDLGSGLGNLCYVLKNDYPQSVVIGTEKNTRMVQGTCYFSELFGIKPDIFHSEFLCLDKHGIIHTLFDIPENIVSRDDYKEGVQMRYKSFTSFEAPEESDLLLPDDKIKIVVDDIRKMTYLRHLLAGRQVDSASLTFPGSGGRVAFEAPYALPRPGKTIDEATGFARINKVIQESVKDAITNLTGMIKQGGLLLLADRAKLFEKEEEMNMAIAFNNRMRFGDNHSQWQIERVALTDPMEKPEKAPNWDYAKLTNTNHPERKKFEDDNSHFVYMIQTFRRK